MTEGTGPITADVEPSASVHRSEEGFVDHRFKKLILDRYEKISEYRLQSHSMMLGGDINRQERRSMMIEVVKDFFLPIEPLFRHDEFDGNEELYHDQDLGGVVVQPPAGINQVLAAGESPTSTSLTPKQRRVIGVERVIDNPAVGAEWEFTTFEADRLQAHEPIRSSIVDVERMGAVSKVVVQQRQQLTVDILMSAVRETMHWLQDIGIGFDIEQAKGDAGFTYQDIIEEGPPEDLDWETGLEEELETEGEDGDPDE